MLPRIPLTQARTHPKHHPRSSAQRTTAASSPILNPPSDLLDRRSLAYPKCDRAEHHILLSSCYSRIELTPACLCLNFMVGMRCLSIGLLIVHVISLFLKMAQTCFIQPTRNDEYTRLLFVFGGPHLLGSFLDIIYLGCSRCTT